MQETKNYRPMYQVDIDCVFCFLSLTLFQWFTKGPY